MDDEIDCVNVYAPPIAVVPEEPEEPLVPEEPDVPEDPLDPEVPEDPDVPDDPDDIPIHRVSPPSPVISISTSLGV